MWWPRHVPLEAVLFQEIAATLGVVQPFHVHESSARRRVRLRCRLRLPLSLLIPHLRLAMWIALRQLAARRVRAATASCVCVRDACQRRLYALHDAMAGVGDQRGQVSDVIDRLLHWSLPASRAEFGDEVKGVISSLLPSRVCGRDFALRYMPGDSGADYGQGGSQGSASGGLGESHDGSQNSFPSSRRASQRSDRGHGRPRSAGMCSVHKPTFYKFMRTEPGGAEAWNAKVVWQGIKYCELAIDTVMRRGEPVTLMVDGRYDSARGAQHCTVTAMEYETRLVVGVHTLRPKIEGKASNALEVPVVVQLLRGLMDKGLKIRCVVSDDCAALGPKLRAMNIKWQKDCHHKIKNIRKHFHCMLQLKEAKKMYPYGSRLNARALEIDLHGLTEYHAHEVGMWFLRACQLCKEEGEDADSLHHDIMLVADHWAGDHSGCVDSREVLCEKAGGRARLPLYSRTDTVYELVLRVLDKQCSTYITPYYVEFRHTSAVETFQGTIIIYAKKSVHFEKSFYARLSIAVIRWNSHCWRYPVGYVAHIAAGTSIRARPSFRRHYGH
ncbi:hypothetical protein CBR_g45892 [Chara braunii]|uniref:Uncharacterized protein n=1 Tax=Chara braunii TaxID=69332 RepID=A0A388LZJ0_CHABU|nr:hypothetical protein CBR_g45892 [Chara braunii]|eukprot:GBG87738.1 hypothetical protein CBR_g45892 [Chara braunii]